MVHASSYMIKVRYHMIYVYRDMTSVDSNIASACSDIASAHVMIQRERFSRHMFAVKSAG